MRIDEIGKVIHGVTLSRVQAKPGEECKAFKLFTMQDLSRETGNYSLDIEEQIVNVNPKKYDERLLSYKGIIIIGLTSYKALVIDEEHIGKIIPSNFAVIKLEDKKVNPFYFTWYFNEHPSIKKQLVVAMQGSIIRALSIQMLRELDVELPDASIQNTIGEIYRLRKLKEKKVFEKNILEDTLLKEKIIRKLKEDK